MPADPPDRLPAAPLSGNGTWLARAVALVEVLLCSDYPTQFALASTLGVFGYRPFDANGRLLVSYVFVLSLLDTAVLLCLILIFLRAHDERPREMFLGRRPIAREVLAGLPMTIPAFLLGIVVLDAVWWLAPSLHTVPQNPLEALIRTPRDAALFAVVVVVAGGVREEVQRAFLLRRFELWLGGPALGLLVTSVAFGGGHVIQGADAAITTGLLGGFWGIVYLRRRSAIAPIVSHSAFNLLQIVQYLVLGR